MYKRIEKSPNCDIIEVDKNPIKNHSKETLYGYFIRKSRKRKENY